MTALALQEVAPDRGKAVRLSSGGHLKIINTHGTQVVDMWAFNALDLTEAMSMRHTKSCLRKMLPAEGEAFVTWKRRPILTFVEDHSPGVHDTVLPACDRHRYEWEGRTGYHNSCADNLQRALEDIGLPSPTVTPQPFELWMNVRLHLGPDGRQTGRIEYLPCVTQPGDYAVFRAEMDCIVAMSACPYDRPGVDRHGDGTSLRAIGIHGDAGPRAVHYLRY